MPQVDIIQLLKKDGGEKFYPVTHVDAVIGLENNSFFQLVQDTQDPTKYSVKLKPEYTGLWAEGWIAAGGVGTGGGGGGGGGLIQTVYTWSDMQEMSSSPNDDTSSAFNAKTVYEIYKMIQSGGLDGGGYLKEAGGGFFLTSSHEKILLKGAGHSLSGLDDVSIYNPAVNDLLTWSGYSWINIPQSAVRPDLSGYVTTTTFNDTIAGIQTQIAALENFFELDGSGNVTLKSTYQNLWVPGWLAAGGVGEDSSGGVSYLRELLDIKHGTTSIQRADGTAVQNGDILTYDSTNAIWVAAANSGGGGDPSTYVTLSDTQTITGAKTFTQAITAPRIAGGVNTNMYIGNSNNSAYVYIQEDTYLAGADLKGATSQSNASSNNPSWYILKDGTASFSSLTVGGVQVGGGYIGTTQVQSTPQAQAMTGISSVKATSSSSSMFAWDSTNSAWHFYGNIYADGWVAAGGIGSGGGGGGGSIVTVTQILSSGTAIASITVDGVSTTLYAPSGGGGGGSTVSWGTPSTYYTPLTVDGTPKNVLIGTNYVNQDGTQEITGEKTFLSNPLKIGKTNSSNGIVVHQNSYIDIGNARLVYDSGANALHVTYKPGTGNTIGFFADGFVAAGGTAAQTTPAFVTLNTDQSIYGEKTFEDDLIVGTTGTFTVGGVSEFNNAVTVNATLEVNGVTLTGSSTKLSLDKDAQFQYGSNKYATISSIIQRLEDIEEVLGL